MEQFKICNQDSLFLSLLRYLKQLGGLAAYLFSFFLPRHVPMKYQFLTLSQIKLRARGAIFMNSY